MNNDINKSFWDNSDINDNIFDSFLQVLDSERIEDNQLFSSPSPNPTVDSHNLSQSQTHSHSHSHTQGQVQSHLSINSNQIPTSVPISHSHSHSHAHSHIQINPNQIPSNLSHQSTHTLPIPPPPQTIRSHSLSTNPLPHANLNSNQIPHSISSTPMIPMNYFPEYSQVPTYTYSQNNIIYPSSSSLSSPYLSNNLSYLPQSTQSNFYSNAYYPPSVPITQKIVDNSFYYDPNYSESSQIYDSLNQQQPQTNLIHNPNLMNPPHIIPSQQVYNNDLLPIPSHVLHSYQSVKLNDSISTSSTSNSSTTSSAGSTKESIEALNHPLLNFLNSIFQSFNEGEIENIGHMIDLCCAENCSLRTSSLDMDLIGRNFINYFFQSLYDTHPDGVFMVKRCIYNPEEHTITARVFFAGTRIFDFNDESHTNLNYLWLRPGSSLLDNMDLSSKSDAELASMRELERYVKKLTVFTKGTITLQLGKFYKKQKPLPNSCLPTPIITNPVNDSKKLSQDITENHSPTSCPSNSSPSSNCSSTSSHNLSSGSTSNDGPPHQYLDTEYKSVQSKVSSTSSTPSGSSSIYEEKIEEAVDLITRFNISWVVTSFKKSDYHNRIR